MIHPIIRKYLYGWLLAFSLLAVSCGQEEEITEATSNPATPTETGDVILNFTVAGDLSTRTDLSGSDNVQHVTSVRLYIFDGTGDNSSCLASEDIGWLAYFGNHAPTTTATMRYHVKYTGLVNGSPYTFLAIGLDDRSGSTYGLPSTIKVGTTVLSQAIATLAGSEASTWTAIRQSELFAGATILTPNSYGTQGNVDLWRRVAGVMGWFTNVPTQISGNIVSALRITLYTQQNKSVPLLQRQQTPVFKDYINSPLNASTDGQILIEIPVPSGTTSATVLSKGTYVLPVPAPTPVNTNDYTLKVEIVNAAGTTLRSTRVTLSDNDDSSTGNGTGIIAPEGVYRFPIVANRFYGIGTKAVPINLGANLTRNYITSKILPHWEMIKEKK